MVTCILVPRNIIRWGGEGMAIREGAKFYGLALRIEGFCYTPGLVILIS